MGLPNIALQLTSGELVVARLRARHHLEVPLAAERGRWMEFMDGRNGERRAGWELRAGPMANPEAPGLTEA